MVEELDPDKALLPRRSSRMFAIRARLGLLCEVNEQFRLWLPGPRTGKQGPECNCRGGQDVDAIIGVSHFRVAKWHEDDHRAAERPDRSLLVLGCTRLIAVIRSVSLYSRMTSEKRGLKLLRRERLRVAARSCNFSALTGLKSNLLRAFSSIDPDWRCAQSTSQCR